MRYCLNPALVSFAVLLTAGWLCLGPDAPVGAGAPPERSAPEKKAPPTAEPPRDPALRFQLKHSSRVQEWDLEFAVQAIAFVPHQDRLLTLGRDSALWSWDLKSGERQYRLRLASAGFSSFAVGKNNTDYCSPLAVSPDGRFAAVCGQKASVGIVEVYDIREQKKVYEFKPTAQLGSALSLAYSTRGDRLAVALYPGALQWSLNDAKLLTAEKSAALPLDRKNENWAFAVTHLRGDDVMAVGLKRRNLMFYHAQSGEELGSFVIPT
jgi:WD40 repeat protein